MGLVWSCTHFCYTVNYGPNQIAEHMVNAFHYMQYLALDLAQAVGIWFKCLQEFHSLLNVTSDTDVCYWVNSTVFCSSEQFLISTGSGHWYRNYVKSDTKKNKLAMIAKKSTPNASNEVWFAGKSSTVSRQDESPPRSEGLKSRFEEKEQVYAKNFGPGQKWVPGEITSTYHRSCVCYNSAGRF